MKKSLKIGAYIRVSTDRQVQVFEGSLDTQKYRMQEFVKNRNRENKSWGEIVEFYVDEGLSAGTDKRPQYQKMMADVRSGKINLILVADISRLSRSVHDFSILLKELEKNNASYLSMKEQFDTTTPAGRLMINMVVNMAQFEREQTSERVSINCNSRALRGFVNGARAVLGFTRDEEKSGVLLINEEDAKKVRTIFKIFLEQGSIGKTLPVIEALNIRPKGIESEENYASEPRKWNYSAIRDLLMNPAYVGLKEVNKKNKEMDPEHLKPWQQYQVVKASWPAIIDEEQFEAVQKSLEENAKTERRRIEKAERRIFLLSGILRCGECGRPLNGQSSHGEKDVHRYYAHSYKRGDSTKCSVKRIRADDVEEVVVNYLSEVICRSGYFDQIEDRLKQSLEGTPSQIKNEITKVKKILADTEAEIASTFKLQMQMSGGTESAALAAEHLEKLGKQKKSLMAFLENLKLQEENIVEAGEVVKVIEEKVLEFRKGFPKATPVLKRRLVRKVLKKLVLTPKGLETFFCVDENDVEKAAGRHVPGASAKILRFERKKESESQILGATEPPALPLRAAGSDLIPSFEFLLNDGNGWGGRTRTCE
ncbi:MAG: recombinase family protein [Bdellovibrio sp.]|nr:recombinase family protein [Bdellovibrio sp.]